MVFGVVPEDDPEQPYLWGTGTWPRCLTVLSLDGFGFHQEAMEYLEFMLDASGQFIPHDGDPHLWDNFHITGPKLNDRLYDINGHSMKLFEAGKFYLRHRGDAWGRHCARSITTSCEAGAAGSNGTWRPTARWWTRRSPTSGHTGLAHFRRPRPPPG